MQRVTDSLRCIMHKNGYFLTNYIGNFIGCDKPKVAVKAFAILQNLISELGLVISDKLAEIVALSKSKKPKPTKGNYNN